MMFVTVFGYSYTKRNEIGRINIVQNQNGEVVKDEQTNRETTEVWKKCIKKLT